MKCIDLFGGIGGFRLGLEKANKQYKFIWYCDINKYCCQTYNKNFQTQYEPTDIRTVETRDIPNHDMLCAGFPCQSFSIAGKRKGFQDTRGTLFYEVCRIAQAKKPRLVFLENVKGLLSADDGRCFYTILLHLEQLGYDVEWQVLNSKNFGVPQNRERVFIIGHLRETSTKQIFPLKKSNKLFKKSKQQREIEDQLSTAITQNLKRGVHSGGETLIKVGDLNDGGWDKRHESSRRVYGVNGIAPTVPTKSGGGVIPKIIQFCGDRNNPSLSISDDAFSLNANPMSDRQQVIMESLHHHRTGEYDNGIKINESFTLDSGSGRDLVISNAITPDAYLTNGKRKRVNGRAVLTSMHERRIRRLTPVECERLQGFPDGWTEEVSDTQRYKQLGNAVTVNVVQAIGGKILDLNYLDKEK